MRLISYLSELTGQPAAALAPILPGLATVRVDGAGNPTIAAWNVPGVPQPTNAVLAAVLAAPEPAPALAAMATALVAAAQRTSNAITAQIARTQAHLAGYQSAANMVRAAGNAVPTAEPDKDAFALLTSAIGIPAATLAALVVTMDAAAVTNLAYLLALEAAATTATTAAQLATALTTFQANVAALVTALNGAGLTTTVSAPAAISVAGINA